MRKKAFILLFPHNKFVDFDIKKQTEFNRCIQRRYIDKHFDFIIVNYPGCDANRISAKPTRTEYADITFFESITQDKYPDFRKLAKLIKPEEYEEVVVGGFHCFDCVERLANEIYSLNDNTIVDVDLTERFDFFSRQQSWTEDVYNPNIQEKILIKQFHDDPTLLLKRYRNPIWGISETLLSDLNNRGKAHKS